MLLDRLAGQGEEAEEIAQRTLDAYVSSLDYVLREEGIGDLSMGKKMKSVASLLMGRLKAVRDGLSPPDAQALEAYLGRTVYADAGESAKPAALAEYTLRAHAALAAQPLGEILKGRPAWPAVA